MPLCKIHGFYSGGVEGRCPKCVGIAIRDFSDQVTGKTPIGRCPIHGPYYAKYKGIYDGCPVCAREENG
jgi:hypothetical protein